MSTTAPVTDPYAAYGGAASTAADPYAAYGGSQVQQSAPAPSLWQTMKDNFNSNTQGAQPGDGMLVGALHNFTAGGGDVVRSIAHTVIHPLDTIGAAQRQFYQEGQQPISQQLSDTGNQVKNMVMNPSRTLGQLGTGAIVGEAVSPIVRAVPRIPSAVSQGMDAMQAARNAPTTALTPEAQSAVAITKAVNPASPAWNSYLESAEAQTGNVLDYAKRNNIPINSVRDFAAAAKGAQQETLAHYQQNFLNPHADVTVPVEGTGYQGQLTGNGRATLADINSRVDAINRELNANVRKPTTGQAASAGASDADLEAEKRSLTPLLHQSLADAAGVQPDDIAALRVRGGQLKTLASETQGAANQLSRGDATTDTGVPSIPTSTGNVIQQGVNYLRGGPEAIAGKNLVKALGTTPITPTELIKPTVTPDAPTVTTPEAAQQEFLRSQQLTQAAQDAAAQRGQVASAARQGNTISAGGPQVWTTQGAAKVLQHVANDSSVTLKAADLTKLGQTPQGAQLLIKASDLQPGSAAMKNIVQQIKQVVSSN